MGWRSPRARRVGVAGASSASVRSRLRSGQGTTGSSTTKRAPARAVGPVLDPHPAAVEAHVLVDEGQAEADAAVAGPVAGRSRRGRSARRSRSRSSSAARRARRPPRAICTPSSTQLACSTPRRAAGVLAGVVEQVGDTRTKRRLSARTTSSRDLGVERRRARRRPPSTLTAWMTSSADAAPPRGASLTAPASKREISSRSSTSCWKRSTSADSRSSAAWARSGISSRRVSSTSTDAASVMSGERSSWLTSDANGRRDRCGPAAPGPCG